MNEPRMDATTMPPKLLFEYVSTAVTLDAKKHLCITGEVLSSADKAKKKAGILAFQTNWPAAVKVLWGTHYRVLSSDGHTLYDVTRKTGSEPWTCSCPAHGPCWHQSYANHAQYISDIDGVHLPVDFLSQPVEAGDGQVRSMAGRSRLYHDEVA